jgi:hypothetical protein
MIEEAVTRMHFEAGPEATWNVLMFYEEVSGRPPFPLNIFMPDPVRTEGGKHSVGDRVRCIYQGGDLVKRITCVDPPHLIRFEVIGQSLGIEGCVIANCGSYELVPSGTGTDVVATTRYYAYLHPRWIWRPIEELMTAQLHRHVLNGMRAAANQATPVVSHV